MADRPNVCASCNKRMSRKSWYYRNGQYFCKKRCFETAKAKAAEEGAKAAKAKEEKAGKTEEKPAVVAAPAKVAQAESSAPSV